MIMDNQNLLLNLIFDTDSYKPSQWLQYPPNTTKMYSYFESRGGYSPITVFFGLQYILKKYFTKPITITDVEEAKKFMASHGVPFNYEGWMYIAKELKGKLPVRIKAVPEGSVIPISNILMSIESTDPKVFWIVNYLETALVRLWYPISVATNSWHTKQIIKKYLDLTSDDTAAEIDFKLHDFGSRGATSQESAMIGGAAHLINFKGSDTIAGVWMANEYYNEKMAGFSIPASEHSTMTMWGRDNEVKAYENMIKQFGDNFVFACVSDSYDIFNAISKLWGEMLKEKVLNMKAGLVVRPDSGDPVAVPVKCVQLLDEKFGHTLNSKGYKVLNKVRVIQGDGIDKNDVDMILGQLYILGYSATNITFGMGGGLLQKNLNRDTHKFAFKCSWAEVDGKEVEVFKQPITDTVKKSKKGKLDLIKYEDLPKEEGKEYVQTVPYGTDSHLSLMRTVYENGELLIDDNFADIRKRTEIVYEQVNRWTDKPIYA